MRQPDRLDSLKRSEMLRFFLNFGLVRYFCILINHFYVFDYAGNKEILHFVILYT